MKSGYFKTNWVKSFLPLISPFFNSLTDLDWKIYLMGRERHFIFEQSYLSLTETMKIESFKLFINIDLIFSFSLIFNIWIWPPSGTYININLTFLIGKANPMGSQCNNVILYWKKFLHRVYTFFVGEERVQHLLFRNVLEVRDLSLWHFSDYKVTWGVMDLKINSWKSLFLVFWLLS